MAGKPSYTRKQIEFVLIHILDKVALHRIIDAFKETFGQDVTIGQIKYLKSKYGKDPDFGSPLLEGRVRIVEELATLLMSNFEHWNAQKSHYQSSQQGYGDQIVQGHSCLLSGNSLSYTSHNTDGPETSWDTVGSPQQGQTMPNGQLNKTQDSYQPFASRQPSSNTPRLSLQDDPWPGLPSGAQSQLSIWPAPQGSEDLPPPPYSEDHPGLGNTITASHISTTGSIPDGIDNSLFNSSFNSNLTAHETQALQLTIDVPQAMPDETSNGIGQCGNTFQETAEYKSHDASTTDTNVDQQSSYSSDALELVRRTHDHAASRGVGEGWSFFDEAVAFTDSRKGSIGEHGNLDEADTPLAAAFTDSEMAGAYMD
ncbi:predicted protein [Verticillium alfalfae VaMs.102]|uniref:Predicted protein n=1 Tax=Verticillium alfalfae (strain VaMs.102 / ATCC MYA-4576 / FGSC 10136) TaxID=526221 RepID=C9SH61_VERA1|nr:predicted protein [Verticillium alfalfae VaMs.102]EEY17655.1 predicted protein [Verticillium alfalfae VaMs.102]